MYQIKALCPVCDAAISVSHNTQESEIISCHDCQSRLVVEKIETNRMLLQQAPAIEEDWGE